MHPINARERWTVYPFQGRFASYPMDQARLLDVVRYLERAPVAAGMALTTFFP